jgi:hypothetical protein
MRLGEGGMDGPVLEVDIDDLPAAMGGGDFHHGVIDGLGSVGFASMAMIPPTAGESASTLPIST